MKTVTTVAAMRSLCRRLTREGKKIGFVPTMGALHKGHTKLLNEARKKNDIVILSIYINPSQFVKGEDFDRYPKTPKKDCETAKKNNVDILFIPNTKDIYPTPSLSTVTVKNITKNLCGKSRIGHFCGVATIITKLFTIIAPTHAYFGMKDYQQLRVINQLNTDFFFGIKIVPIPTVREDDGLAVSSRNKYLTHKERVAARCLYQAILKVQSLVAQKEGLTKKIIKAAMDIILSEPLVEIEYITICDPVHLLDLKTIQDKALFAVAVKINKTRLIDNCILEIGKKNEKDNAKIKIT